MSFSFYIYSCIRQIRSVKDLGICIIVLCYRNDINICYSCSSQNSFLLECTLYELPFLNIYIYIIYICYIYIIYICYIYYIYIYINIWTGISLYRSIQSIQNILYRYTVKLKLFSTKWF